MNLLKKVFITFIIIFSFPKQGNFSQPNTDIEIYNFNQKNKITIFTETQRKPLLLGSIPTDQPNTVYFTDYKNKEIILRIIQLFNLNMATLNDVLKLKTFCINTNKTIEELNLRAFLGTIKFAEGHGKVNPYNIIYGGDTVTSLSAHPNRAITKWGYTSTAAGSYGILYRIWKPYAKKLNLNNFSGKSQDLVAIEILKDRKLLEPIKNGGLSVIHNGKYLSILNQVWTPFPKGSQQGTTIKQIERSFNLCFLNELKGKTTLEI